MTSLDGIRILDLSRVLAGPWCTQTLADLGADVIKIERPGSGDDTRGWGPPFLRDAQGQDTRGGRLLPGHQPQQALGHLRHRASRRARRWCASWPRTATCSSRTSRSATWRATGWTTPRCNELNPRLVYCSVTGFGQTGPYRERAGYDYAVQGMGGLMSITGERDDLGGGPQKVGVAVADLLPACIRRWAEYMPVNRSATATPTFCGPPPRSSRSPVTLIRPPMPCIGVVVARPFAIGTGLAEAGHAAIHQPGIQGFQRGVVQPVARHVADLEVLDEHIAMRHQLANQRLARRLAQYRRSPSACCGWCPGNRPPPPCPARRHP